MNYPDTETFEWATEIIDQLRDQVQRERERRILAALWGSQDEECPRVFSLYRPDDLPESDYAGHGIIGYGCTWSDGFTLVQRKDLTASARIAAWTEHDLMADELEPHGVRIVWLAEDLDDLTAALTEAAEHKLKARAQDGAIRATVTDIIRRADPWEIPEEIADRVLTALFGVDKS